MSAFTGWSVRRGSYTRVYVYIFTLKHCIKMLETPKQDVRWKGGHNNNDAEEEDIYKSISPPNTYEKMLQKRASRKSTFYFLVMAQILVYAEAGAVPALLPNLTESFDLSYSMQGFLGGIVYIGISIGAPLASSFFQTTEAKNVLMAALLINGVFVLFFALPPENWSSSLLACRFMMGMSQSFLAIFTPVWVDVFATRSQQTQWFSWIQASTPVGIMFGYLLGFIANSLKLSNPNKEQCFGDRIDCWRLPFIAQAILTIPLCIKLALIPKKSLSINGMRRADTRGPSLGDDDYAKAMGYSKEGITNEGLSRARADSAFLYGAAAAMQRTWSQTFNAICDILLTGTFTITILVLSSLYFVVTSVQFWATDYLINGPQRYPEKTVMLCFIVTSATGPIFGVLFGGWAVDKIGGYRSSPEQKLNSISLVTGFAVFANIFAFSATFWPGGGMWFVMGCIWFLLFFGGSCLPALTGIFIDAVPRRDKALGSSMSQMSFNFLGYFMSPVLSGELMARFSKSFKECEQYKRPGTCPDALEWGFRASLFGSAVALFFVTCLWWHLLSQTKFWKHCKSRNDSATENLLCGNTPRKNNNYSAMDRSLNSDSGGGEDDVV
eukprot:g9720.t1